MQAYGIYLIKMVACSGIFYVYYRAFLFNRGFHRWNRFYLLATMIASTVIPFLHLNFLPSSSLLPSSPFNGLLNTITNNGSRHDFEGMGQRDTWSIIPFILLLYTMISAIILLRMVVALQKIHRLVHHHHSEKFKNYVLVHTQEPQAPFSFFRYIFWNTAIDPENKEGLRILQHEETHVREWHSADKLLANIIIVLFWCNPVFWIMRREISLVHEFIADSQSFPDANRTLLASMILSVAYPKIHSDLTSHFYFSPVKRRLCMLSRKQNTRNYFSRFFVLLLCMGTLAAFSFTHKEVDHVPPVNTAPAGNKVYTIVIDAGHGGTDAGAVTVNGTEEKNIVLEIARKIREKNTNKSIRIELTRTTDIFQPLSDKVAAAVNRKADAFISLHLNNDAAAISGFDVFVSNKSSAFSERSQLLGTVLSRELQKIYAVNSTLQKRTSQGIWVLDAPTISYPAILLECGNLANQRDLDYVTDPLHQDEIAKQILRGIEAFANAGAVR